MSPFRIPFLTICAACCASAATPPVDSVVVFNEIMYHPADPTEAGEYVELHNQMGIDIDLSDWEITGGVNFIFADGTVIPGGGHLVVARTPGLIAAALGPYTGALNNSGETLRLRDKNRRLMDEVSYGDAGDWPVSPDGSGVSLSKRSQDSASPLAGNWTASAQVGGTPGDHNFPPPAPAISGRVIDFFSVWKYNNSGIHPGATWADPGYDDDQAGWEEGVAAFDFGSPTVYSNDDPGPGGDFQEITGVTIEDFSSEATTSGLDRPAVNCINGSGLTSGQHTTIPDGNMWLSRGILAPADPLPAHITFDLGATQNLTSLHVWNYNENTNSDQSTRGARNVQISVASSVGGTFTSLGNFEFTRATGEATYTGETIPLIQNNVRLIRFNITTNWGASNQFVGLSEVKFFGDDTGTPPAPPVFRDDILEFYATGVDNAGELITAGNRDPHYINTADNLGAVVEVGHPAWLGPDGISQWVGPTANGTDNTPPATITYLMNVDLSYWRPETANVQFFTAVDNSLDVLRVNGDVISGVNPAGFGGYLGPFTIPNINFIQEENEIEFVWTNAGATDNPAGFRAKWEATAEPILARTTLAANPAVTWFRKSFVWNGDPASTYKLRLEHLIDDGAVFYLNGTEVLRNNVPVTEPVLYPQFSGLIEIPASAFVPGENIIAVELHQPAAADIDALFGMTLDLTETPLAPGAPPALTFHEIAGVSSAAGSFFIELANSGSTELNLDGFRIRDSAGQEFVISGATTLAAGQLLSLNESTLGFRPADNEKLFLIAPGQTAVIDGTVVRTRGRARTTEGAWQVPDSATPGSVNSFSIPDSIVINEIMYNHMPAYLPTGTTTNPEEWVELYNRSGGTVDLTGWKLRGGADYNFPSGTSIPADGYLVVASDPATLSTQYPGATIVGPWSGGLSNSGDIVRIEDTNDNTVNEVIYTDGGRWSDRADGGGSSLELRHPDITTSLPESWAASDETSKASWQTITYSGSATPPPASNDPTQYNEFILGLLNSGEVLVDDVSVINNSTGGTQLIQNGNFSSGNANTWRLLGNHGLHGESQVINGELKIVASGATEHMHNHCETTLKSGGSFVTINSSHNYTISFRAKWQTGSPRLQSRLYFNRLSRQHILSVPTNNGTPGAANSQLEAQAAPVISGFSHSPVIPEAGEAVTVSAKGATMLHWRLDPATTWNDVAMTDGTGTIPGQDLGSLVQFYVSEGTTDFPAAGPDSRAMIQWANGITPPGPGHGVRILLPEADANQMHDVTQVMSNWYRPCTIIYRETEVFYHAHVRLRSSQRGRNTSTRVGFAIQFDPTEKFRGVHEVVNMDRSAYGEGIATDNGFGQVDIINQQVAYRAGGIPAMYNDMIYLIAPRSANNGSSQMTMAEFNDVYLDSQWSNGADSPTFKLDLIYYPTTTSNGTPEGLKNANPDLVNGVNIGQLTGASKEDYRWHFLIGNARANDDYSRLIAFNHAINRLSAGDASEIEAAIDVDQWLRASAMMSLVNSNDSYSTGGLPHNLKLYVRPDDGRVLYLPWDADFFKQPTNFAVVGNGDLQRMLNANPVWRRVFYGHLHDIIATSYNTAYLSDWTNHLSSYTTALGDWNEILTYVQDRSNFVLSECASIYPSVNFSITTNGGNNFSTASSLATLNGNAWIDVREIRIQGNPLPLAVTWTGGSTWSLQVPVSSGPNAFTLEALNFQGEIVATDAITISGTGNIDTANASNIVISEFDYNPAAPTVAETNAGFIDNNDFEFIELQNISNRTVDLSNCRFDNGIVYTFANGTLLPAGGRLIIPKKSAAFSTRYPGVASISEYVIAEGNSLRNSGEEIALVDAGGQDIKRFSYGDNSPWPSAADGNGAALTLIAPDSNPNHSMPFNWRSAAPTPGSTDALPVPVNPTSTELLAYASGSAAPNVSFENGALTFQRETRADALFEIETSSDLETWLPAVELNGSRQTVSGSIEEITQEIQVPPTAERWFARVRFILP
jgi:hypothetical protein